MAIKQNYKINLVIMITYVLMMMITEFLVINTSKWWDPFVSIPFNTLFYVAVSWVICLLVSFTGKTISKYIHVLLHVVIFSYTISNIFLSVVFHRHWDAFTLQFLRETNLREATEFIQGFIFDVKTLLFVLPSIIFFVVEYLLAKRVSCVPAFPKSKKLCAAMCCVLLLLLGNLYYFSTDYIRNYEVVAKYPSPIKRNNIWTFYQSILQYQHFQKEYDSCENTLKNYTEHAWCTEKDADFVLIIGESFNRHYSNLYDGKWNTNPRLLKLKNTGRLFVFSDVIASDNGTSQNFKYLFSMNGVRDKGAWCDAPLLPTVMRRCGYKVIFYGNQFVVNDVLGEFDSSMGFLNHPYIAANLFDERNVKTYKYDMGLVEDYVKNRMKLEKDRRNFCIFHLYGQHMKAETRYPETFKKYNSENVGCKDKTKQQREDIANYLNATLYNDYVVSKIIELFENRNAVVLYLSDHGEEIHDFRNQYGRTDLASDTHQALKPQLDIPFMIYFTPTYAGLHPYLVKGIKAALNKRFMSDDMAQVVCDILGVKSRFFRKTRSLINYDYSEPKHRILQNHVIYD